MNNSPGVTLIAERRRRQIDLGYTPEHDRHHVTGSLIQAAVCYATPATHRTWRSGPRQGDHFKTVPATWPWDSDSWRPSPDDRVKELAKAGALIAAEIDRLLALGGPQGCPTCSGSVRETVGMVCQTCGTDYGRSGGGSS